MKYSVIEVMRDMGVIPDQKLSWTVGSAAREKWQEVTGNLPEKELRPKTSGQGSHCFAVYPASFRKEIRRIVQRQLQFRSGT